MLDNDRVDSVKRLLFDYVRSPSLKHIRDPYSVIKLAKDIVRSLDRQSGTWRKWDGQRDVLIKEAAAVWLPLEDLRTYLNEIPGPHLTATDVQQRLQAGQGEDQCWPQDSLKDGCLALYEREKAEGTELPAIVGALRDYLTAEEERERAEGVERYRRQREEERIALEQRFLSGADCKWTPVNRSAEMYCRVNGRAYRLTLTKDKRWQLHRIAAIDGGKVELLGLYLQRKDVTKALAEMAYKPEYGWP